MTRNSLFSSGAPHLGTNHPYGPPPLTSSHQKLSLQPCSKVKALQMALLWALSMRQSLSTRRTLGIILHVVLTGEAAADQVMALASAALKEAQVAFAACVTAQPAMLSEIISRLRSLLLSSARLSEGELLRRTDDLGPTTAQTAPHRVWHWSLTADGMSLGTGPGSPTVLPCPFCACF